MLLGLRSLWESGGPPPPAPVEEELAFSPWSGPLGTGKPVYIKKKKPAWPGDEIEEEELEELLAMLGIDL